MTASARAWTRERWPVKKRRVSAIVINMAGRTRAWTINGCCALLYQVPGHSNPELYIYVTA